ncbi:hypothetical protein DL89DRAFT_265324 [Linderina pennispora]|uniref:ABC transporter domain-containing protein n=1 Tax=Linderina pennispora TaxID=61395 RepID=A0A1Y1WIN3_9FUNG|nr:uncharacterized protein DL89DRAFT_265324 [Linderina pennispora]ORX73188.1 hypothetical protein DL89DRAFT_265324 [Linderina pennispora]
MDISNRSTTTFQLEGAAIADLLVLGFVGLWGPAVKGVHPLAGVQRLVIITLCASTSLLSWYSHAGTQFNSTLAILCSLTLAFRTASLRFSSDIAAMVHALWSLRLVLLSDTRVPVVHVAGAVIHFLVASLLLSPATRSHIRRHVRGLLFLDTIAFFRLCTQREITMEDIWDPRYCTQQLELAKRLKFDITKRFFALRAVLELFWQPLLVTTVASTLLSTVPLTKSIVMSRIIKAIDSNASTDDCRVYSLFALWMALSLFSLGDAYLAALQRFCKTNIFATLKSQTSLEYRQIDHFKIDWTSSMRLVDGIDHSTTLLSNMLANSLTISVLVSTIGWRTIIPLLTSLVYLVVSHSLTAHLDMLEKAHKRNKQPHLGHTIFSLIHNMRTIKFYGWEEAFRQVADDDQVDKFVPPAHLRIARYVTSLVGSSLPQISAALTVSSFLHTSNNIEYADILLVMSSAESLTGLFSMLASATGIIKSISETSEELEMLLRKDDYHFQWNTGDFALKNMDLRINKGEFAVVVGRVGTICSEMPITDGTGLVSGKIGYVSQKPWIMNATVRDNFYHTDIKLFPAQDLTEIGFRGINLSGGQKARLALARAIYSRADIFVLDDLLAAVDAHNVLVGERGIISGKTRILVTHAEHVVPLADRVVTLVSGFPAQLNAGVIPSANSGQTAVSDDSSAERGLWQYIMFCGFSAVGPTFIVYRVESNRETMVSSLQNYLVASAVVGVARTQVLWSHRVYRKTRAGVLDSLLSMPLVLFESLPGESLMYLWGYDRKLTGYYFPETICQKMLAAMDRFPILLFFAAPIVLVSYKVKQIYDNQGLASPYTLYSEINTGGYVMRIQGFHVGLAVENNLCICYQDIADLQRWLRDLFKVIVSATALLVTIRRCVASEIEMTMRLLGEDLKYPLGRFSRYSIYTGLPREPDNSDVSVNLSSDWPTTGTIEFRDYSMRYRESQDLVLNGVSFSVRQQEKIGSSLTFALMRLVSPDSGAIFIDGHLRSKISIIPQDPALFNGTIRENLDPLNEFTDDEGCIDDIVSTPTETYSAEGTGLNKNFSVGQRQLRKILVLDEATANRDCTVLTIAHRLRTVMDSDRILVMDQGRDSIMELNEKPQLFT